MFLFFYWLERLIESNWTSSSQAYKKLKQSWFYYYLFSLVYYSLYITNFNIFLICRMYIYIYIWYTFILFLINISIRVKLYFKFIRDYAVIRGSTSPWCVLVPMFSIDLIQLYRVNESYAIMNIFLASPFFICTNFYLTQTQKR